MQDFEIWCKHWVWLIALCKTESASSCLSFPLFVHFAFSPIKFFVKDFWGTTVPKSLKFHINIGYNFLYCVRENQHPHAYPLFVIFSFSPIKYFITDFSAPKRAIVFKFCIHLQTVEVCCVKEIHNAEISFDFFLPFFHCSLQCNA